MRQIKVRALTDLKHCPCCSGVPKVIGNKLSGFMIVCRKCGLRTEVSDFETAAKNWNFRPGNDTVQVEIEGWEDE